MMLESRAQKPREFLILFPALEGSCIGGSLLSRAKKDPLNTPKKQGGLKTIRRLRSPKTGP
jgi:hypothetical protein